jgi:hypothetical protein
MVVKTKNFDPATDVKLLCTCGHESCDERSVRQVVLNRAQLVRDVVGPLEIRSGGRCPYHPDEIHRETPADHQLQNAVDVGVTGWNRGKVVKTGIEVGFNAIGVAKTFVHLGYRADLQGRDIVMWIY